MHWAMLIKRLGLRVSRRSWASIYPYLLTGCGIEGVIITREELARILAADSFDSDVLWFVVRVLRESLDDALVLALGHDN